MSSAMVLHQPNESLESKVELIKRTVAKGATQDELEIFMHQCRKTGLDPLAKQIYFQKRINRKTNESTITIITGIDGYRLIADRTGKYAGNDDCEYDDFDNQPKWAKATVYKIVDGQRCAFTATARWKQYCPEFNDFMWKRMPHLMLGKCAEALALRKAFPAELSGVYTAEEMQQAEAPVHESIQPELLPVAEAVKPTVEGFVSDIAQVKDSWFYKVGPETCTTNNEKLANKLAGSHGLKVKLQVHSQKLNDKVHIIVDVLEVQIPEDLTPLLAASVEQAKASKTDAQAYSALFDEAESLADDFINEETGTVKGIVKTYRPATEKVKAGFVEVESSHGTIASLSTFSKTHMKRLDQSEKKAVIIRFKRSDDGRYMNITDVERVGEVDFTEGA